MSRPSIFIATPCFGGMVTQNYMLSVIRLMNYARSSNFDVSLLLSGYDALISRARSTLVATFLDNPVATHLLFVDADISFQPQQVERLLASSRADTLAAHTVFATAQLLGFKGCGAGTPFKSRARRQLSTQVANQAVSSISSRTPVRLSSNPICDYQTRYTELSDKVPDSRCL